MLDRCTLVLALLPLSCATPDTYTGTAIPLAREELAEPGWLAVPDVIELRQERREDCGAAALATVLAWWGAPVTVADVRRACPVAPEGGIAAGALRDYARGVGLEAFLFRGELADFEHELVRERPVVVGLAKPHADSVYTHYEVVVGIHPGRRLIATLDPARGWRQNSIDAFLEEWEPVGRPTLVVFRPEPPVTAATEALVK